MDEMKKYIIEFSEDPHTVKLMKIKNGDKFPITEFKTVKPYTEPDLEQIKADWYKAGREAERVRQPDLEQVRKEAYDKCMNEAEDLAYKLYSPKIDEAYQRGLNEAWETARKIRDMTWKEQKEVFGTDCYADIIALSASECIEKIRQYEQRREEPEEQEQSFTVEEVMRQYLDTFCAHSRCTECPLDTPDFTCGRGYHFLTHSRISDEEVRRAYVEVRQKMEEN